MALFALIGNISNSDNKFVSLTGSDQLLPIDGRLSIENAAKVADKHIGRMVRVQPYVNAYQICRGSLKNYRVLKTGRYPWNQVFRRQIRAALDDLDKNPLSLEAVRRIERATKSYINLIETLTEHRHGG